MRKIYVFAEDEDGNAFYSQVDDREDVATLIDKVSGRGTWDRNPFVWRIEFELVK